MKIFTPIVWLSEEEQKAEKKKYQKECQAARAEEIRANNKAYWVTHAEELRAYRAKKKGQK